MTARDHLTQLYAHWRRLTECETESIRADAWERLAEIHRQKSALQQDIIAATEPFDAEFARLRATAPAAENPFRKTVAELILLEARNAEILSAKRAAAKAERANLDRTTTTLRHVARSYGHPIGSVWHSYS